MIKRAYILSATFLAFGALVAARTGVSKPPVDEMWLEKTYPAAMDSFHTIPSANDPLSTYKMDELTYRKLNPFGIVSRVMTDGSRSFDVVVISGSDPDTFHNPLACFAAQEWKLDETRKAVLQTQSRGPVPVMITHASKGGATHVAVYTYEGPTGIHAENNDLHRDLFWSQLKTAKTQYGTFFRFVSQDADVPDDEIMKFATNYIDHSPVRPVQEFVAGKTS